MGRRGPGAVPMLQTQQAREARSRDALRHWRKAEGARYGVRLDGRRIRKLRRVIEAMDDLGEDWMAAALQAIPEATEREAIQALNEHVAELEAGMTPAEVAEIEAEVDAMLAKKAAARRR